MQHITDSSLCAWHLYRIATNASFNMVIQKYDLPPFNASPNCMVAFKLFSNITFDLSLAHKLQVQKVDRLPFLKQTKRPFMCLNIWSSSRKWSTSHIKSIYKYEGTYYGSHPENTDKSFVLSCSTRQHRIYRCIGPKLKSPNKLVPLRHIWKIPNSAVCPAHLFSNWSYSHQVGPLLT